MILDKLTLIGHEKDWNKIVITNTDDEIHDCIFENHHIFARVPTKISQCTFLDEVDFTDVEIIPQMKGSPMAKITGCVLRSCVIGGNMRTEQNYFKPTSEHRIYCKCGTTYILKKDVPEWGETSNLRCNCCDE